MLGPRSSRVEGEDVEDIKGRLAEMLFDVAMLPRKLLDWVTTEYWVLDAAAETKQGKFCC